MSNKSQDEILTIVDKYKSNFPVKVGTLAHDLGVKVIATNELPEGVSGSFARDNGDFTIYVDASHPVSRQRFTIAHELGHFVKHRDLLKSGDEIQNPSKKEPVTALNRPNKSSYKLPNPKEKQRELEADEFAADLLMPSDEFKKIWATSKKVSEVADHFKVSPLAANTRGMKLGLGWFD